jgi:CheY-like chemotaxis protein
MERKRTSFRAHALRVLIVEDDEDTATSLGMLLEMHGYEVELTFDGPSAVRAVQVTQPDVVLLDIGLPKMNGWQVAKQIREQTPSKRPLLIAISGYGMQADRLRSREVGIDLHLIKPVDPVKLELLLKRFQSIVRPGGMEALRLCAATRCLARTPLASA